MARPLGSKNRTARELETAGKNQIKEAKLKKQNETLKKQNEKKK